MQIFTQIFMQILQNYANFFTQIFTQILQNYANFLRNFFAVAIFMGHEWKQLPVLMERCFSSSDLGISGRAMYNLVQW
jgi:hypothetical protein